MSEFWQCIRKDANISIPKMAGKCYRVYVTLTTTGKLSVIGGSPTNTCKDIDDMSDEVLGKMEVLDIMPVSQYIKGVGTRRLVDYIVEVDDARE